MEKEKKKTKLKLADLKVQSFVTAFDLQEGETLEVRGGSPGTVYPCTYVYTQCTFPQCVTIGPPC